jgi:hypothetical protein
MFNMWVLVKMINTIRVKERCPALDAVDDVSFLQQELSEIRAVLAGDPGY